MKRYNLLFIIIAVLSIAGCSLRVGAGEPRTAIRSVAKEDRRQIISSLGTAPSSNIGLNHTQIAAPQFVVLSFDGSRDILMWQATRGFAREMLEQGTKIHFTYFVSGVFFLTNEWRNEYLPPREKSGYSLIGFAESSAEVAARVDQVNQALAEGHEIGSHLNGHFDGRKWTMEEWQREFDLFHFFLFDTAFVNHVADNNPKKNRYRFAGQEIAGMRAPLLGINNNLWPVLKVNGYRYDASRTGREGNWPLRNAYGIWEYPLDSIEVGVGGKRVLAMDYNMYLLQSRAKSVAKKGTPEWNAMHDEVLSAYLKYFNKNFQSNRAPVIIGHHFSLWNDGVYWEVMKDFARDVCVRPKVQCVSFRELTDYLDKYGLPKDASVTTTKRQ